jgi:protein O-GlcNAc transferase
VSTLSQPDAGAAAEQARTWLSLGTAELEQGRPSRALEWLTRAERAAPRSAAVLACLGVAQKQTGLTAQAIQTYERALALDPAQPSVWVNLARARREAGQLDAALSAFQRALALAPLGQTFSMASNLLREMRRYAEAIAAARLAIEREPRLAEAHLNEGAALHLSGHFDRAAVSYLLAALDSTARQRALHNLSLALAGANAAGAAGPALQAAEELRADPERADTWLALARIEQDNERAIAGWLCLEQALERRPTADGYRELGSLLWKLGRREEAERALSHAIELEPDDVANYRMFGGWFASGEHRPGPGWLELLEACPDDPVALSALGGMAQRLGHPVAAQGVYQRLCRLRPHRVESHLYLALALCEQGLPEAAKRAFERALELDPSRWDVFSGLLFCLHLLPDQDPRVLLELHRSFGARLASATRPAPPASSAITRDRLRIGYVSPDLCAHPVSYFLEPVLREHDRARFEVFCYSDVRRPDAVTERLAKLCTELVASSGWSHDRLAERIQSDRIDILVDLAGHTSNNRLPTFARRPSPVQVSWLGYFDTTGLEAIDYRIADRVSVPVESEPLFVEKLALLPRSQSCYAPPPESPAPAPPPCLGRGYVTFGCFNNPMKIGRDVNVLFARVLRAVPHSRLLFKYRSWNDPELVKRHLEWLAAEGVPAENVDFEGASATPEFMAAFSRIDVALDPFPYSGETTALHTLWMGVPLVALEGPTLVQRLGSRVLRICGLDAWVAETPEAYLALAAELASDPSRLAALRNELRARLAASPLCDHRGVTRELEAAYQTMWRERFLARTESPARTNSSGDWSRR